MPTICVFCGDNAVEIHENGSEEPDFICAKCDNETVSDEVRFMDVTDEEASGYRHFLHVLDSMSLRIACKKI